MEEEKIIKSPKEDIAKVQVLAIEDANYKIKSLIVKSLSKGEQEEDFKKLNSSILKIINENGELLNEFPILKENFLKGMKISTQRWFKFYTESLKNLNNNVIQRLSKVGVQISGINALYNNKVIFRNAVANSPKGLAIIKDYENKVMNRINVLVTDNPTTTYLDKNGKVRKRNLRNEAETFVRLEANKKDIDNLKDRDVKLVITTSHADCSPRCQPWQNRLFSLDGTSGNLDGMRYIPLQKAMEGKNGDGNGIISGYNCRHRAIEYKKNMIMPKEYSQATIKKERAIDSKQRYYENSIRQLKVKAGLLLENGNIEKSKLFNEKILLKEKEYKKFSLRNQRAFYTWRTEIDLTQMELDI